MAVAFDAHTGATSISPSFTHTPVGTPRAVIVFIRDTSGSADQVSGVTYGGVAMSEISGSPNIPNDSGTDSHFLHAFFLGSGIPTGAQTVAVTETGSFDMHVNCITLTADADTEIVDSDGTIDSTSTANPSVTLSLGGRTSFAAIVFSSGHGVVGSITPLTGWTGQDEDDSGVKVGGCYTYDTIGSTDVTAGWTQTAEDAQMIAVAVTEAGGGDPGFEPPNVQAPLTLRSMGYGRGLLPWLVGLGNLLFRRPSPC
jgi:hypothetical protein